MTGSAARPVVTIVMYHFVRPAGVSRFAPPAVLDLAAFQGQMAYLRRHYSPVHLWDVIAAAGGAGSLPARPVVLTFDDGYRDHFAHAFPVLRHEQMPAMFFPVASSLIDRKMLDTNKVQLVLAAAHDPGGLADEIDDAVQHATDPGLPAPEEYHRRWRVASRFDPPDVAYVKRMLQHALPASLRATLVDALFRRHVGADPVEVAEDLYFTLDQAREMVQAGMDIGAHGDRHIPLTALTREEQARETDGARFQEVAAGRQPRAEAHAETNRPHEN